MDDAQIQTQPQPQSQSQSQSQTQTQTQTQTQNSTPVRYNMFLCPQSRPSMRGNWYNDDEDGLDSEYNDYGGGAYDSEYTHYYKD